MRRILIGDVGAIVSLGLRDLIVREQECEIVGEGRDDGELLGDVAALQPDVVLLDLDDAVSARRLARTITTEYPKVKIIACSSMEPRTRVFPPFSHGESYVARMSPKQLIEAVKNN